MFQSNADLNFIGKQLKRIADALEDSNKMIKDISNTEEE